MQHIALIMLQSITFVVFCNPSKEAACESAEVSG
jgi:hypothetical protein